MSCGFSTNIYNSRFKFNSYVLGKVEVPPLLEGYVKGVYIKVIDNANYKLNINMVYHKQYLRMLNATPSFNNPVAVDIFFNIKNYLEFLYEKCGRLSIDDDNCIIAIWNIPDMDNAFYNGSYMVFGNGKTQFKPLVSPDVVSHELTHGLCKTLCNLEYKGHSGALNESLSDVVAVMYEFYLYEKYNNDNDMTNNLLGNADWLIGEDIMKNKRNCLRDFINPHTQKQPVKLNDIYYINPLSNFDNGGVHINSGIINHLFYKICLIHDKYDVLELWIRIYKKLNQYSNFDDFVNVLKAEAPVKMVSVINEALIFCNLIK